MEHINHRSSHINGHNWNGNFQGSGTLIIYICQRVIILDCWEKFIANSSMSSRPSDQNVRFRLTSHIRRLRKEPLEEIAGASVMNNQKCMKSLQIAKYYSVKQERAQNSRLGHTHEINFLDWAKENKRLVNALSDELVSRSSVLSFTVVSVVEKIPSGNVFFNLIEDCLDNFLEVLFDIQPVK